ncbi:MAG: hypothetical protein ACRESF_11550, partial [Pseudomonas sp.]
MSELRRVLAMEGSFDWEGRTYKLAALSYEALSLWEEYLEGNALRSLERARRVLSQEAYGEYAAGIRRDLAARVYGYLSDASAKAEADWQGKIEMAAIRLFVAESNDLDLAAARKLAATIQEHNFDLWCQLQEKMRGMDNDPNSPGPAAPVP